MCGIVGLYHVDGAPVDRAVLRRMTDRIRHRGPDDQGLRLFTLRGATPRSCELTAGERPAGEFEGGLGFNRLSILDLSAAGHQPMASDDGQIVIIFNGEIYNAFDLRPELEAAGARFRSRTDTEVVLRLYERYGMDATLERLNGMYALALVDLRRRELLVCRDRLGIKPLYWYERDGAFLFASEVKAFYEHPAFRAELDELRLDEFLAYRYCAGDGFLLRGVRQLEPGTCLRLGPGGRRIQRYWDVPEPSPNGTPSFEQNLERFDHELKRSVRMQLLSDVKVGCQLSGGVDSSMVNLFATLHAGADMDAFSIVFEDPRFSEEPWIDRAAAKAHVRAHKSTLDACYFVEHIERATWHLDEPLTHPNSIGIWRLSESARGTVKVLLSGEGADELLGGYNRFLYAALRPKLARWLPLLGRLPGLGPRLGRRFGDPSRVDHVDWFLAQSGSPLAALGGTLRPRAGLERATELRRAIFDEGRGDFLRNCLRYELKTYLVDLLVRQDKMTMAHSLENRVPFLDHELVAFVRTLPSRNLVDPTPSIAASRARGTKLILKRLASRYFERDFVYRAKGGFVIPLDQYFVDARFARRMEESILPGMRRRGLVDAGVVEGFWRRPPGARAAVSESLWSLIALEVWAQLFLDGRPPLSTSSAGA